MAQAGKSSASNSSQKTSTQYDIKKRSRQFVDSWKKEFPWATEVKRDGQNYIICSICSEYSNVKENPSDLDRKNSFYMDVVPSGKRRWNHTQKASNMLILKHGKRTNLAENPVGIKF